MASKIRSRPLKKGEQFNRWTVLTSGHYGQLDKVPCKCNCGTVKGVKRITLVRGTSQSCGCRRSEVSKAQFDPHAISHHTLFPRWKAMHDRCYNKSHEAYSRYGDRGITVCEQWHGHDGFLQFVVDMGMPPTGGTLDRKNNDLGYSPCNCRWITLKQQQRNKSSNRWITIRGQTKCMSEWAESCKHGDLFCLRIKRGWDPYVALVTPPIKHGYTRTTQTEDGHE